MRLQRLYPSRTLATAAAALVIGQLLIACGDGNVEDASDPPPTELLFAEEEQANDDLATDVADENGAIGEPKPVDQDPEADASTTDTGARQTPTIRVIRPLDGETVPQTFEIEVDVDSFELQAAGRAEAGKGHWHVIVDEGCVEPGEPIPRGADHFHTGDGSNTRTVQLSPGPHELCIQVGDGFHVAVNISDTVNVTVR